MKIKLTIILVALICGISSATSLPWKSDAMAFNGTSLKSLKSGITGYVVYLSSGTLSGSYTINESFTAATVGTVVSSVTGTSKGSASVGTFQFDYGTYKNGDSFALIVAYDDAASGKTYWNLSSTVNTLDNISDEISTPSDWTNFAVSSSNGTAGLLTAGGGWVAAAAVPEPATGALALAGIALLLKRRKAAKA